MTPAARRGVVEYLREQWRLSERRSCGLARLSRSVWRYRRRREEDTRLRSRLVELAGHLTRHGLDLLHLRLRREGFPVNRKRTLRLYREERLALRPRSKRKHVAAAARVAAVLPTGVNERWSMDFMSDSLANGRVFRTLNVVDDFSRECLSIEVDTSLPGERVVRVLERLACERLLPAGIVLDNGPEFVSRALDRWAYERGVELRFIRPGKPVENCFVESFNGTFRNECLNAHWFASLPEARWQIERWRQEYNTERPHTSLRGHTPREFAALRSPPPSPPPATSGPQTQTLTAAAIP